MRTEYVVFVCALFVAGGIMTADAKLQVPKNCKDAAEKVLAWMLNPNVTGQDAWVLQMYDHLNCSKCVLFAEKELDKWPSSCNSCTDLYWDHIKEWKSCKSCSRVSQISPASPRTFLPEYVPGLILVLESHFTNGDIRSQINKFHVLVEFIPPSITVQIANIILTSSSNPHDELDAAILQQTQPSTDERVQQLLQHDCIGDLRPNALLGSMKQFAPEEPFDASFWKLLYFKKPSSYIQSIWANALTCKQNQWSQWQKTVFAGITADMVPRHTGAYYTVNFRLRRETNKPGHSSSVRR
ncbi:unnamed protein product [Hymenolepis diminuta]|uniref:DUF7041 domain-containing protein n=1 Tax=Hymenolepis diminuta TaxID=6216 RepID=A0A564Z4P3_HYMDI|nr:unnamed protein product [Hymenolepis diminuta]